MNLSLFLKGFLLFGLIYLLPNCILAQAITCQIIDSSTRNAIPDATIRDSSGKVMTFSNNKGYFKINDLGDNTLLISCLGYKTLQLNVSLLKNDCVIKLNPVTYSLPPVFIGNYAVKLIKAA